MPDLPKSITKINLLAQEKMYTRSCVQRQQSKPIQKLGHSFGSSCLIDNNTTLARSMYGLMGPTSIYVLRRSKASDRKVAQ